LKLTNKIEERTLNCACVSVSANRSRSWTFQSTSHVNYPVTKIYNLAEQTGSSTHNPTGEEYGSIRYNRCSQWGFRAISSTCLRTMYW